MMLAALSTYHAGVSQIVIAGGERERRMASLRRVVDARHLPAWS